MIITPKNGSPIRGDLIYSATLRSDLSPVPMTFEGVIRVDDTLKKSLSDGSVIAVNGDDFYIVKSESVAGKYTQGSYRKEAVSITAILDACKEVAYIRQTPIIKERSSLATIYRAAGAKLKSVGSDFSVPRFSCFSGFTPSYYIAQALQEEGGLVRWKSGRMQFFRLADFFKQKPVLSINDNVDKSLESGFLKRHEVPMFFSIGPDGSFLNNYKTKARTIKFSPHKDLLRLGNMTRCLVHVKTKNIELDEAIAAGDLIEIIGSKPLVVVTAAHYNESGTDGNGANQYTRVWLSRLET